MDNHRIILAACSSLLALALAGEVRAQSTPPAENGEASGVGDIIVTAQRRSENLQSVPVAVSAVTTEMARFYGVIDTRSLGSVVAGLDISQQGNGATPFLRGIGSPDGTQGSESSVATFVDGVYISSPSSALFGFDGVQRIEVLKGPQGTLFGRNATGGVIHVITKDPSHTPSADIRLGYGNYNTVSGSFYGTAGLSDTVAVNLTGYVNKSYDGWGKNLTTGQDTYKNYDYGVRGKLMWQPSDATTVRLSGDYTHVRTGLGIVVTPIEGAVAIDTVTTFHGLFNTQADVDPYSDIKQYGASLNIEQDLGFARLVSISAYRHYQTYYLFDYDTTPIVFVTAEDGSHQRDFTQEIQLQSPTNSKVNWIVGAFYLDSKGVRTDVYHGVLFPPNYFFHDDYSTKSISVFGQATAQVFQDTRLTLGVRYTSDKKDAASFARLQDGTMISPLDPPAKTFSKVTWRASLDHNFTPDVLAYASYNRGFKSGGYNSNNGLAFPPVKPEILDAYEIGLKTTLLDHKLRFNAAAFYYDYKDIQVNFLRPEGQVTLNAASAKIYGIEGEMTFAPTPRLTMTGAFTYLHGRYGSDFTNAPASVVNPIPPNCMPGGPCGGTTAVPGGVNADGFHTIHTPTFTGNIGLQYRIPTSTGTFDFAGNFSYNSGYFVEVDNRLKQPKQHMLGGSIGWTSPSQQFEVRVWGKNLLQEKYYSFLFSSGFVDTGSAAPPRTFGVTLTAHLR